MWPCCNFLLFLDEADQLGVLQAGFETKTALVALADDSLRETARDVSLSETSGPLSRGDGYRRKALRWFCPCLDIQYQKMVLGDNCLGILQFSLWGPIRSYSPCSLTSMRTLWDRLSWWHPAFSPLLLVQQYFELCFECDDGVVGAKNNNNYLKHHSDQWCCQSRIMESGSSGRGCKCSRLGSACLKLGRYCFIQMEDLLHAVPLLNFVHKLHPFPKKHNLAMAAPPLVTSGLESYNTSCI